MDKVKLSSSFILLSDLVAAENKVLAARKAIAEYHAAREKPRHTGKTR